MGFFATMTGNQVAVCSEARPFQEEEKGKEHLCISNSSETTTRDNALCESATW